jgi:uncharacterized protein DUF2800
MRCTSSPKFIEKLKIVETTSDAAEEGTGAHELLDLSLKKGVHTKKFKGKKFNKIWEATPEMVNKVGLVWEWVQGMVLDGYELTHESRVNIKATGDSGTLDVSLRRGSHLIICDLKYGRGVTVLAEENEQMLLYACGHLDDHKLWMIVTRLTLVIWQPRQTEEPRTFDLTIKELNAFRQKATQTVAMINSNQTSFNPGEKQCQWCPAKAECKSFAKWNIEKARLDFDQVMDDEIRTGDFAQLAPKEIFAIWKASNTISKWLSSINAHIYDRMKHDDEDFKKLGLKLVEGKSNRRWKDDEKTIASLSNLFEQDAFAPRSLLGITAIANLFPNNKEAEAFLSKHTVKPPGSPTLTTSDDPREEMRINTHSLFEDL